MVLEEGLVVMDDLKCAVPDDGAEEPEPHKVPLRQVARYLPLRESVRESMDQEPGLWMESP